MTASTGSKEIAITRIAAGLPRRTEITKKDAKAALKAAGLAQAPNVDIVTEKARHFALRRHNRFWLRAVRKTGYVPVRPAYGSIDYGCPHYGFFPSEAMEILGLLDPRPGPARFAAYVPDAFRKDPPTGRKPVALPKGALAVRLRRMREAAVLEAATGTFRYGAAGGYSFTVALTEHPEKVGYQVSNTFIGFVDMY